MEAGQVLSQTLFSTRVYISDPYQVRLLSLYLIVLSSFFFPPLTFPLIFLHLCFHKPTVRIENHFLAVFFILSSATRIASIDLTDAGGATDFINYYTKYVGIFESDRGLSALNIFPGVFGVSPEFSLPFVFLVLSFFTDEPLGQRSFLFVISSLFLFLIYLPLHSFANRVIRYPKQAAMLTFMVLYLLNEVNAYQLSRQGLAMVFLFMALTTNNLKKASVFIVVASTFHYSSLVIAPIYLILRRGKLGAFALIATLVLLYLFGIQPYLVILSEFIPKLSYYTAEATGGDNFTNVLPDLIILSVSAIMVLLSKHDTGSFKLFKEFGGWWAVIFFLVLYGLFYEVELFAERLGLAYLTFFLWLQVVIMVKPIPRFNLAYLMLVGVLGVRFYQKELSGFFWYEFPSFGLPLTFIF